MKRTTQMSRTRRTLMACSEAVTMATTTVRSPPYPAAATRPTRHPGYRACPHALRARPTSSRPRRQGPGPRAFPAPRACTRPAGPSSRPPGRPTRRSPARTTGSKGRSTSSMRAGSTRCAAACRSSAATPGGSNDISTRRTAATGGPRRTPGSGSMMAMMTMVEAGAAGAVEEEPNAVASPKAPAYGKIEASAERRKGRRVV